MANSPEKKQLLRLVARSLLVTGLLVLALEAHAADPEMPPYPERGLKGMVTAKRLPIPDNATLLTGMKVWQANCRVCHGNGVAGAPKITGSRYWVPRIAKGLDALFDSALNGFSGKDGTMPPKGGKSQLTDTEVKAAVRYMIANSGGLELALEGL